MSKPGSPTGNNPILRSLRGLPFHSRWNIFLTTWLLLGGNTQAELIFEYFTQTGEAEAGPQSVSFSNQLATVTSEFLLSEFPESTSMVSYAAARGSNSIVSSGTSTAASVSNAASTLVHIETIFHVPEDSDPVRFTVQTEYELLDNTASPRSMASLTYVLGVENQTEAIFGRMAWAQHGQRLFGTWMDSVILGPGQTYGFAVIAFAHAESPNIFPDTGSYSYASVTFSTDVTWSTVPEPSSLLLALLGVGVIRSIRGNPHEYITDEE